ncbi:Cyclic AMP-dependent protein kinase [Phytophthora megakarya]|uniref:Cyclic AMP-dependent protein kinase n=1 Tax=Phytophthora megakarya TaxID=4795 RepID=A0A225VAY7_9STRA|nr:Cyclic AMP-dependent protein kinase [Phytophthora megakarya]
MREMIMDGAPELNGLVAKQTKPVEYRPMLLGLVKSHHEIWKDMVSQYVNEKQNDWDDWIPCAMYAYNGARHEATGYSPNELMIGRRLRAPNELLRIDGWPEYHRKLVKNMASAAKIAKAA